MKPDFNFEILRKKLLKLAMFYVFLFLPFSNLPAQKVISKLKLPNSVNETSGLEIVGDYLITLNDSGNPSILYYFGKNGDKFFTRNFNDLKNNDWEDLTVDNKFIYIADTGNNFDTRKDLRIIKIPIDPKNNSYEFINFYYPEQKKFKFRTLSRFDAEGLISIKDYLLIFTKNRDKKVTDIYMVPKLPGNYKAELVGRINTKSIVTGADYNKNLKLLVLTSTTNFNEYFIIKIKKFKKSKIDDLKFKMYKIPIDKTQVESIKIIDKNNFWITSEAEIVGSPYLYKISL